MSFGFIVPKTLNYLTFQSFCFESTWRKLFQKHVVRTRLEIYVLFHAMKRKVEQEIPTLPEHLSSPPVFSVVRVTRSLFLYVCFVDRCLSLCTFFCCPLCCLFFFDIRILITPQTLLVCMFCRSLCVLFSYFICPLCFLSFDYADSDYLFVIFKLFLNDDSQPCHH